MGRGSLLSVDTVCSFPRVTHGRHKYRSDRITHFGPSRYVRGGRPLTNIHPNIHVPSQTLAINSNRVPRMRSICPLSVPSSGEYVYVTAEPISLPYSRLLHPPDISLCPSTLLPPILFPLCVLCPSVSLSLPTSLPIAL